jgi:hypothetical protein
MNQEIIYIVHLTKETKTPSRWFAVLKKTPEFGAAYVHGVGIWMDKDPTGEVTELDTASIRDEYIPWHRIDHITNCVYKPR